MSRSAQLDLFCTPGEVPQAAPTEAHGPREDLVALAARLPPHAHFGTSSWTFPGWRGLVYRDAYRDPKDFVRRSLGEYARFPLFRTVGIDRSQYAPIPEADLRAYATQLPAGFRCVMKVWDGITAAVFPDTARGGARRGQPNPDFLSAELFTREVAAPVDAAFRDHVAAFVLELAPSTHALAPRDVERRLEAFFGAAPRAVPLSVELRDRRLLTQRYLDLLRAYEVAPALNHWSRMPPLAVQLDIAGKTPPGPVAVARLLLPPGTTYDEQKRALEPFDQIKRPDPLLRAAVVRFVREAGERGVPAFVIVNNKVEGSSPLTIQALAQLVAVDHEGERSDA